MKTANKSKDTMRNHYDFRGGVRGKFAARYAEGTNVVLLDADVAAVFRDSESVNRALRVLIDAARRQIDEPSDTGTRQRRRVLLVA